MEDLKIIKLTKDNIQDEHICCAFSDKKCAEGYQSKKDWLKAQFDDGYVFRKLNVRGKVFIEYVPAEKGWVPVDAPGFMLINCFWVSGKYKGQGYGSQLYQACEDDARKAGMKGIVVVTSKKKQPFMSDLKFFKRKGFELADEAPPYFQLWYKPLDTKVEAPRFKEVAKSATCDVKKGLAVYYTHGCPFNEYYVNVELKRIANERGIPIQITHLKTAKEARQHFVPHTLYSVFYNGNFVTQHVLNEKQLDRFIPALAT
jgi:GNAT superfamily N-acetyltransferase